MDYYYGSSQNMSSRGRFSSRGGSSYMGGGRGESSYRGSRGSGGYSTRGYSGSRGRGGYYPKYESSSKYSSDGGNTRYGSHNRMDDNSYRKQVSYGSGRDHSHHRSDVDIGRKRIRSESYSQSQGTTGSRRSHEMEDYRGSGSRYSNSNSYTDSRGYGENREVFKKPRMSDFKSKEEYRGRKEAPRSSVVRSKLRSFRGRAIRGRTVLKRGGDRFLARKRAMFSGAKTTSELIALRRTKMMRLQRLKERAKLKVVVDKALAEDKKKEAKAAAASGGGEEDEEGGETKTKEDKFDKKNDEKGEEKDKDKEEGEIPEGDSEVKKEKPRKEEKLDFFGKPFMKLQCPQCLVKCITFNEYAKHLYQPVHVKAMKKKSEELKQTLASMRIAQRAKQKEVDEEDLTNMNTRSAFCLVCKLKYSQLKSVHQSSEAHQKLKNFLQPYCKVCRIPCKSPMAYETHICSLEHVRKKNRIDAKVGKGKGSLEYLNNFMVLDSVGSGDEAEESKDEKTDDESKKEKSDKKDKDLNLGAEFIQKVDAYYCEVCRSYLRRVGDYDRMLKVHCSSSYHLKCYLKFGSDELLDQIQRKKKKAAEEKATEEASEDKSDKGSRKEGESKEGGKREVEEEEKLWADVTDLLSQVEQEVKSEEEEEEESWMEDEEEGGRFDRFKSNENKGNGELATVEGDTLEKEDGIAGGEIKTMKKEGA